MCILFICHVKDTHFAKCNIKISLDGKDFLLDGTLYCVDSMADGMIHIFQAFRKRMDGFNNENLLNEQYFFGWQYS